MFSYSNVLNNINMDNRIELSDLITECVNDISILNEANSIKDAFLNIINKIIKFIYNQYKNLLLFLETKIKDSNSIIKKYKPLLESLSDSEISEFIYEKIDYNIDLKIPVYIDIAAFIDKNIDIMASGSVNKASLYELKEKLPIKLSNIRGQIMGLTRSVTIMDFDIELERLFIPSKREVFETRMAKTELMNMIKDVENRPTLEKQIKYDLKRIIDIFDEYRRKISNMYVLNYTSNSKGIEIKLSPENKHTLSIIDANYYIEYQSTIINFIVDIIKTYSVVVDHKLQVIKEKVQRESEILKQLLLLIDKRR